MMNNNNKSKKFQSKVKKLPSLQKRRRKKLKWLFKILSRSNLQMTLKTVFKRKQRRLFRLSERRRNERNRVFPQVLTSQNTILRLMRSFNDWCELRSNDEILQAIIQRWNERNLMRNDERIALQMKWRLTQIFLLNLSLNY